MNTKAIIESVSRNENGTGRYKLRVLTQSGILVEEVVMAEQEQRSWLVQFNLKVGSAGKAIMRDYKPYIQMVFNNAHIVKEIIIDDVDDALLESFGVDVSAKSRRR
jgi:hypothetical protein